MKKEVCIKCGKFDFIYNDIAEEYYCEYCDIPHKFKKELTFSKDATPLDLELDPEVVDLCNIMNSLPGIETFESCCGHSCTPYSIYFRVKDNKEGLFFLTRCIDRRYWTYGYLWKIELQIGDQFIDGHLPINYHLYSGPIVGEDAYKQANSLVKNMISHLNHEGFIKGFDLNLDKFLITENE